MVGEISGEFGGTTGRVVPDHFSRKIDTFYEILILYQKTRFWSLFWRGLAHSIIDFWGYFHKLFVKICVFWGVVAGGVRWSPGSFVRSAVGVRWSPGNSGVCRGFPGGCNRVKSIVYYVFLTVHDVTFEVKMEVFGRWCGGFSGGVLGRSK